MKFTAEDFANRLAGGMDKHEAVKNIKEELTGLAYKCKIARRQTATGRKIYFTIEPELPDGEYCRPWWKDSEEIVLKYFPDAHITSGSSSTWTFAEY
jgi:hypothetical protein